MSINKPNDFRSNIVKNIETFINDPILSTNLEKAIFNYSSHFKNIDLIFRRVFK